MASPIYELVVRFIFSGCGEEGKKLFSRLHGWEYTAETDNNCPDQAERWNLSHHSDMRNKAQVYGPMLEALLLNGQALARLKVRCVAIHIAAFNSIGTASFNFSHDHVAILDDLEVPVYIQLAVPTENNELRNYACDARIPSSSVMVGMVCRGFELDPEVISLRLGADGESCDFHRASDINKSTQLPYAANFWAERYHSDTHTLEELAIEYLDELEHKRYALQDMSLTEHITFDAAVFLPYPDDEYSTLQLNPSIISRVRKFGFGLELSMYFCDGKDSEAESA